MFEFGYYKGHGWLPGVKFSIKHYNNGWHRFFEITVPIKNPSEKMCNFVHYQLTYWNNHTNFCCKEKKSSDTSEPQCVDGTQSVEITQ